MVGLSSCRRCFLLAGTSDGLLASVLHRSEKSVESITDLERLPVEEHRLRAWSSTVLCFVVFVSVLWDQGTLYLAKEQE